MMELYSVRISLAWFGLEGGFGVNWDSSVWANTLAFSLSVTAYLLGVFSGQMLRFGEFFRDFAIFQMSASVGSAEMFVILSCHAWLACSWSACLSLFVALFSTVLCSGASIR